MRVDCLFAKTALLQKHLSFPLEHTFMQKIYTELILKSPKTVNVYEINSLKFANYNCITK